MNRVPEMILVAFRGLVTQWRNEPCKRCASHFASK